MFMTVRLETRSKELVADKKVLPMHPLPEIMLWGMRHFILVKETEDAEVPTYREGFAYAIIDIDQLQDALRRNKQTD